MVGGLYVIDGTDLVASPVSQRRTTGGFEKSSETARANWKVWTHLQRSTTTILSQPRRSQHMTRGAERNSIQKRFVKDEPRNCTSWTRSS